MPVNFTDLQEAAIKYRELDACVVAGPGSGKTTVLVERFVRLVREHSLDLHSILAITFTEKAAANMKAKIAEAFSYDRARQEEAEDAWISTIHGFCSRLLRENAVAAGIDPGFGVMDQFEADELQRECMNAVLDRTLEERREATLEMMEHLAQPDLGYALLRAWDALRSAGSDIAAVRLIPSPGQPVTARELAAELRAAIRLGQWTTATRRTELHTLQEWAERIATDGTEAAVISHKIDLGRVPTEARPALRQLRDERIVAYLEAQLELRMAPHRALVFDVFQRFADLYTERKRMAARLDFNDLESVSIRLLRQSPETQKRVRTRFRQVMLDEYQDINEQQQELVNLIRGEDTFFGVGDRNQSIYGFRHARPEIFRAYQAEVEEHGKQLAPLAENFRSRQEILNCVAELLRQADGIEPRELIARGEFSPQPAPCVEVLKVLAADSEEGAEREAGWIAERLLELQRTEGRAFRDFGILCRTRDGMEPILRALDARRIPYVCGHRQSWLVSRDGRDLTAMVALLDNPRDEVALTTVLRSPLAGISDEALLTLRLGASSLASGLNSALHDEAKMATLAESDARKLRRFSTRLARWRAELGTVPLEVLLARITPERNPDIESFLALARGRGSDLTPRAFLRLLEQMRDAKAQTEIELSDQEQGNRVQVMTAHGAKGLEFPVTFVASMNRSPRYDSDAVNYTRDFGLGIKWLDGAGKPAKDSWHRANSERIKTREDEEENRLLYVAMTRAEDRLILSWSQPRKAEYWARRVSELYGLADLHNETTLDRPDYSVSVRVVAEDAPVTVAEDVAAHLAAESEQLPAPAFTDLSDSIATVTSVALFAADPDRYFRERYLGLAPKLRRRRFDPDALPEDTESAADIGTMVHAALAGKPGDYPEEVLAMAETFRTGDLGRRAALASRAEREWEFIQDVEDTLIRGSIDLWFAEPDGLVVVDYKTDDISAEEAKDRARDYSVQLALYANALPGTVKAAYLHFLRPDAIVEVNLSLDLAIRAVRNLRAAQNQRLNTTIEIG